MSLVPLYSNRNCRLLPQREHSTRCDMDVLFVSLFSLFLLFVQIFLFNLSSFSLLSVTVTSSGLSLWSINLTVRTVINIMFPWGRPDSGLCFLSLHQIFTLVCISPLDSFQGWRSWMMATVSDTERFEIHFLSVADIWLFGSSCTRTTHHADIFCCFSPSLRSEWYGLLLFLQRSEWYKFQTTANM